MGAASVIAPAYIAEISPATIRGRLGSLQQLAIVIGIFGALLSDFALASAAGSAAEELWFGLPAWRWMFITLAIPAVAYGALSLTIPESPRFLVAKGAPDRAKVVLSGILTTGVDERIAEIQRTVDMEEKRRATFADLRGPVVWVLLGEIFSNRIRAAALGLAAAAQWIGNFAISTTFPVLADLGLAFAYGLYTFFAVLSFLFVMKFVRETKGRQLEDME